MFDRDHAEIVDLLMKCLIGVIPNRQSLYEMFDRDNPEVVDLLMKYLIGVMPKSSISL